MDAFEPIVLTEDQINHIADKAATRAIEMVYAEVGKSIVKKLLWLVGAAGIGLLMFLAGKGVTLPKLP